MSKATARHAWAFTPRLRAGAFGWRSNPAIERIKEAVAEIKAADRKAPLLAAEGRMLFLRTVSSALRNGERSSGAIGSAVNRAIEAPVPIIAQAPVDGAARRHWLDWRTRRSYGLRAMLRRNRRWNRSAA